jgi:[protein-PII] uridylyltransferase
MAAYNFSALSGKLKDLRQNFLQACRDDVPGLLAARTYAGNFKGVLRKAFTHEQLPGDEWALVAVGGFGRGELSYASDIDLLFLYQRRLPQVFQDTVRELIYTLWDGGFEVGHVTASVSEVNRLVQEDFSVLTTYLETSLIAGNKTFYDNWRSAFLKSFGSQRRKKYFRNLVAYRNSRLEQFGESSYLLEPHVKEGVGGLRDIHILRWSGAVYLGDPALEALIRQAWITPDEERWLEQAHDFLWRVRLQLHQLTGRRQDQLLFPEQEQAAARLGFMDGAQGSAVEAFMRLYYRHTARIRRTVSFFLDRLEESQRSRFSRPLRKRILPGPFLLEGRHLHFLEPEWINKDPRLLMRFFWQTAQSEAYFHHHTGQVIREHLGVFTDKERRDPEVVKQFMDILLHPRQSFPVLKMMLEIGFLEVFLPEYAAIRYRAQYDVYHLYTVDQHLLRTVRELHKMEQQEDSKESMAAVELNDIFVQLENRHILYLTALLHDIGKGQGKNHSVRGAEMVLEIGDRLGLNPQEIDLMSYLVENHLLLVETALKRDLSDEKPILACAVHTKDRERLRLLYLLSIADSRATGPSAWNTWKASLLRELYFKVDRLLFHGDWKGEDVEEKSREVQNEVLAIAGDLPDRNEISSWLDSLSYRYLLSQPPKAILEHYRMEKGLAKEPVIVHAQSAEGDMWQITVATKDRPGLFAIITGVLWARGLNILSADIFTRRSGIALDVLTVERLPDPLHSGEVWKKIQNDLTRTLEDRSHLDSILSERRKPSILQRKYLPRKEDRVLINEEASDFYTIIEVYTWDRPGVLHNITNTFYTLGVSIQLAKISTPGAQVADVFYVTDLDGNKLLDPAIHENVRTKLLECLTTC